MQEILSCGQWNFFIVSVTFCTNLFWPSFHFLLFHSYNKHCHMKVNFHECYSHCILKYDQFLFLCLAFSVFWLRLDSNGSIVVCLNSLIVMFDLEFRIKGCRGSFTLMNICHIIFDPSTISLTCIFMMSFKKMVRSDAPIPYIYSTSSVS